MIKKIFLICWVGCTLFLLLGQGFQDINPVYAEYSLNQADKYTPQSQEVSDRYQDFINKFRDSDPILYQEYLSYGQQALNAIYKASTITGTDNILDYGPLPEDMLRLDQIISNMSPIYRSEYINQALKRPVFIIIGGSSDLPLDSLLYFVHISEMLNIPWYVINNNRNNRFSRESQDIVISDLSLNLSDQINQLIINKGQNHNHIWVDVGNRSQLQEAVSDIMDNQEYQMAYIFIVTHGTEDSLIFSTSDGNKFNITPQQLTEIIGTGIKTNLFLGTCYSTKFGAKLNLGQDNTAVTASEKIAVDGDMAAAVLMSLYMGDYRVTDAELKLISSQTMADNQNNYCYTYYVNGQKYYFIDDKVTHAHKVRFGAKESDLDIKTFNLNSNSLLYFHVRNNLFR